MAAKIRLKPKDRLTLLSDLGTMLTAGIPILEAVDSLRHDAKGNFRRVLHRLYRGLSNGEPLSRVMGRMPDAFDPITINLIRAAEAGGTLEETLQDIVASTKKEIAFSDTIRTATIYPIFVMAVFFGIVLLMLTFVIPRIAKVFLSLRVHIPTVTRITMTASDFFVQHWLLIMAGLIVFIIVAVTFFRSHRRAIIRLILSLPGMRRLGTNIDLTRFTRSLSLLMHAGVPVEEALRLSADVVQRKDLGAIVAKMRRDVTAGLPLSQHLRSTDGIVPVIMARSIETAETSGTLEKTLQQLAEYFDNEVNETLKVLTSLLEPILILVVGIMVGLLMITIIAPIYNMISQISPKT